MAWQGSGDDKIAELLKQAYPPTAASPAFKADLRLQVNQQAAAMAAAAPKPLWQQPFVWIPATAACTIAAALIIFFVAFQPGPPAITTGEATSVQATAATLNGRIDSLGESETVEVSFEWGPTIEYGSETTPEVRTEGGDVSVALSGLKPSTTYHYRLKIAGRDGIKYGPDMQFTTGPAPPVTTTHEATEIGTTSATLSGSLDYMGSATSVQVYFQWGLTPSYGNETAAQPMSATGEFSAELNELDPGTTYYFCAKADGDGDPVYGAAKTFTTLTIPPSVTTRDATSVTTISATLKGDLTSLGTADSITVFFEWGTASGSYGQRTADQLRTVTGGFSAHIGDLDPGTTYYFRAGADGDGSPVYGEEKSFVTLTVPPSMTTGSATDVRCTSARLNGILQSRGTAGSVQVSFEWGLTAAYGHETPPEMKTATGDLSARLTGLSPETTYHFRSKAVGDGVAYGSDMMFTTGKSLPPQMTWYLSNDLQDTANVMYHDNTSNPVGTVPLHSDGSSPVSEVWRADQSLAGTTYPGDNWTVHLALSHLKTNPDHEVIVEIGTLDGGDFTSYGTYAFMTNGTNDEDVFEFEFSIRVDSFTVPSNGSVATRITVTNRYRLWVDVHVGGSQSYVTSPAYPDRTAPEVATGEATGMGQTTVVLNGSLNDLGSADSVTVCFEWGTTTAYGNETAPEILKSPGGFRFALDGLVPNTTYHFRAKVVGDGTNYGTDIVFTTLP